MAEKVLREAINIDPTAFEAWLVFLIFYFQALLLFSGNWRVRLSVTVTTVSWESLCCAPQYKALVETHHLYSIVKRTRTIFSPCENVLGLFFFSLLFTYCNYYYHHHHHHHLFYSRFIIVIVIVIVIVIDVILVLLFCFGICIFFLFCFWLLFDEIGLTWNLLAWWEKARF